MADRKLKIAAYTVITGNYDQLRRWTKQSIPVDFFCFTDNPEGLINEMPELTKMVTITQPLRPTTNRLLVPFSYRLFPFEIPELSDYDLIVYLDGNVQIRHEDAIERYLRLFDVANHAVSMIAHPMRDDLFDEIAVSKQIPKYRSMDFDEQIAFYQKEEVPRHCGLWVNNLIFWNRHLDRAKTEEFQEVWFNETTKYGKPGYQDFNAQGQVTLGYIVWKLKFPLHTLPRTEYNQTGFRVHHHG